MKLDWKSLISFAGVIFARFFVYRVKMLKTIALSLFFLLVFFTNQANADTSLAEKLSGRILLQTEERGEAWYVAPEIGRRVFLGRPDDAFSVMKKFGLGIRSLELDGYLKSFFPQRLLGKILINVDRHGEAFYINPVNSKGYYLNRPADAFKIMAGLALGIKNVDLDTIKTLLLSVEVKKVQPIVLTDKPALMTGFSQIIQVGGEVFDINNDDVLEKGIVWGFESEPTIENNIQKVSSNQTTNKFSVDIIGLSPGTYPYVRAYLITKNNEIFYGNSEAINGVDNKKGIPVSIPSSSSSSIEQYTLTYTSGSHGSISGTLTQTINSGSDGTAVTATPDTGYHFVDWSDSSTQNPRTDTNVTSTISVTANFAINTYTLTYTAGSHGSILGTSTQSVNHGSDGTAVTASPDTGYHFVNWSDSSTQNPRTDTNVTSTISVTANFAINTYTLTYTAGSHGSVSGTSTQSVNHGSSGTAVTATPDTGYHFVNWSDSSTQNPRTDINVTSTISVTANFAINTYTLTYIAGSHGSILGTSTQSVNHGSSGTAVTASPDTGYHFVNWSDSSTQNPRTDTNVTSTISVTANFAINPFACGDSVVDPRDSQSYSTVQIGSQCWFRQNLRAVKYNDNVNIPNLSVDSEWEGDTAGAYSWYNNDYATYGSVYGALYNYYAVNTGKLCPSGWHVPSDTDWSDLETALGGSSVAGEKLKIVSPTWDGTNSSNFTGLPGGYRVTDGSFYNQGAYTYFWSSTFYPSNSNAWGRFLYTGSTTVLRDNNNRAYGGYIRCLQD